MRIVDRSGGGGGGVGSAAGGGGGAGSGTGTGAADGVGVAQAASCSVSNNEHSFLKSVTEADTHDVDLGCPETASRHVQFIKILDRADIDTKVIPTVDLRTLHA
jgi:hypothetical protein